MRTTRRSILRRAASAAIAPATLPAPSESAEESRLLFVSRDDFYDVLADHVDIVAGLFKHLVQRLRRLATVVET